MLTAAHSSGTNAIDFSSAASTDASQRRYLRQSMGVFGGAYFSQMAEMGLFEMGPDGLQRPTQAGRELAPLFEEAVGADTAAAFRGAVKGGVVTIATLDSLQPIVPARIATSGAGFRMGPRN